jgi:hypothetical protein
MESILVKIGKIVGSPNVYGNMNHRNWIFALILLLLPLGIVGCGLNTQPDTPKPVMPQPVVTKPVPFLDDYTGSLEAARREGKPVLAFFTIQNSAGSQRMLETTFCDDEIKRLASRFVCIIVDASKETNLCEVLGVTGFPTILLANSNGVEIQRLSGKQTPDQLALQMHVAIQSTAIKVAESSRK